MSEELIMKLIAIVEEASPKLWDIALTQVAIRLEVYVYWFWFWIILALTILIIGTITAIAEGDGGPVLVGIFIAGFPATFALMCHTYMISMRGNPEYHAIKILIDLVQ